MDIQQHWIHTAQGPVFAQSWTPANSLAVPIILLHDSLGCTNLWRDFPEQLAIRTRRKVIAYDRMGFGQSAAHPGYLTADFVSAEAGGTFRLLLEYFALGEFIVLGHSVGAGMALSCAALWPKACKAVISISAQAFVDEQIEQGIRSAEKSFAAPGQMERLSRYHGNKAQWVLRAWIDTWLSETFKNWNLDAQLLRVNCPVLALHGADDEYGSAKHCEHIAALVAGPAQIHVLPQCGHMPHREYPAQVLELVANFLGE